MQYPARLTPAEEGGFVVTFRDIPEAITQGDDEADSLAMAKDALITAMDFYFEDKRPVPAPSVPEAGEHLIELPPSLASKLLLLNEMVLQNVTASELARRMGTIPQEINRLIDLGHNTKIDRIGQALRALGKRLELGVS
ncbi:MAG: type toxin-antitoxin system HicB family antitoxin [Massilia sp.]|nr:type toxin-antitoxin system HicB family antitoxin [Massilia sp.]